ncbi:MAG: Hsp70 family protein [Nannocystaceae bacterium]|nr:hsp70 family protein [bacterium]
MSTPARFVVGIDLGTTHCALAASALADPKVFLVDIPQLIAPGETADRQLFPSFMYLPAPGELSDDERRLPWGPSTQVVGELARRLGAKVPSRLVASAKSWVCHGGVNRRAPILPWNSPDDEPHVSPFEAQVAYLEHLRHVWEHRYPDAPLSDQDVVVTVPASFDEGARALTTDAAANAGLGEVRLIEEPQAAFYDYLGAHTEDLEAQLGDARLILVVDVGGGTTDLTLVRVRPESDRADDDSRLERVAVGGHLMLGGDNMDAALAMFALDKAGIERPADATVWSAIVQSARAAKERLLDADGPAEAVISYQGRGSRLLANTRSIAVTRDEALGVLLDGFLPRSGPDEVAQKASRAGLTTLGLPYASDAAVSRHVCSFLRRHVEAAIEAGADVREGLPRPDLVLLNGGVFNGHALIERLREVFEGWFGPGQVRFLDHTSLDTAVARGAVVFGLSRRGVGEAIGGGTARAYYIGVEGEGGRRQALCVAPKGMDDGAQVAVPDRVFDLRLDAPVAFPLYVYTGDRADDPGAVVAPDAELDPLPALETVLRDRGRAGSNVPVTLSSSMTETGALEIYLATVELPPRKWKLEFVLGRESLSEAKARQEAAAIESAPVHDDFDQAAAAFSKAMGSDDPKVARGLRRAIEKAIGPRGQWSAATCRALWALCLEHEPRRGVSDQHELSWLGLAGWSLRPGYGAPEDAARIDTLWSLRDAGLRRVSKATWPQWWILWRRVAAGLDATRQVALFEELEPWLWREGGKPPPGPAKHGPVEMMQLLSGLERISREAKERSGDLFLAKAKKIGSYWPLARVGARVPVGADPEDAVDASVADRWVEALLALDWGQAEGAAFAAASLGRLTGDARRDLSPERRKEVATRLTAAKSPASWIDMVLRGGAMAASDIKRVFGEGLPVGLKL